MPAVSSSAQQKKTRSTKQKLFQCTGFGNCHMIFTRSEHLARHTRKHTGEKPYLCVVPGCTRRFSRFDNMMQHTQTHKTTRIKTTPSEGKTFTTFKYEPEPTPEFVMATSPSTAAADSSDEEGTISSKMSVNQLCSQRQLQPISPAPPLLKELHLTQDEFEALQGFGRFRHTPIFIDSFRDLASVVYIEPNPVRN